MREPTPFSKMLFGLLERAELIALAALLAGLGAHFYGYSGLSSVLVFAFAALGGIYFLMAYRPPANLATTDGAPKGFKDLFVLAILPKVMWISCAIGAAGLSILHTRPDNLGYQQLLLIQASVSILSMLAVGAFAAIGADIRHIIPILYRAIPLALASIYILTAA